MNISSVIPGAEAFHIPGNSIGILLCHGFVGTPQSVEYIGKKFAAKGYTVRAPRLTGHGTNPYDFETATYYDWISDLEANYYALKKTCSEIYVAGQSMGGLLALVLASKIKDIAGIITINVAYEVPGYEKYKNRVSPRFLEESAPDMKAEGVHEITYPVVPITAIKELLRLKQYTKSVIQDVECPVLLFHSTIDNVVPPACTMDVFDEVRSTHKEIIELKNSYHVASMDFDRDNIVNDADLFIRKVSSIRANIATINSI
ncbi:alpha/beta hydrolase [Evansella sp. AB-rgal1]|uniref:alpha/beta hydrolase n=1 Tax=Evansella sp. AB-rgal1 TaxID=3242696 RepID=UPI00359E5E60